MKSVNLLTVAFLCIFCQSALAQEIQQDPQLETNTYEPPSFGCRGMAYSVGYQAEHLEGARYRSLPLTASYKFNSKVLMGILVRPSVITTPERVSHDYYFTVDEQGNHVMGHDRHVSRERNNYVSIPLALMVRADFLGNRRNSPFLEIDLGHDLTQQSMYFQYSVGGRFGFGANNSKALLISGGLVIHNPELHHEFGFGARFGLRIGYEF